MKRSLLLAAFLGLSFSVIDFLPKLRVTASAMSMALPERIGSWATKRFDPSDKERQTLAADTEFTKAQCALPRYEIASPITGKFPDGKMIVDWAELSIVLSGEDLTNSIHRPERCMEAQGHTILDSQASNLTLTDGRAVSTRRLVSTLRVKTDEQGGEILRRCLTYYFFVGHERITADHTERTKIDIKDRLLKGEAQHWAYVLVTIPFGEKEELMENGPLLLLEKADQKAQNLLADLCEKNVDWAMVAN
jgi:hypothetical protein